jgi:hypothetical protein
MDQKKAGAWAMFSHIARDAAFLAALARQIEQDYGLEIGEMAAAERGYYGETWKITAEAASTLPSWWPTAITPPATCAASPSWRR